MIKLIIQIPCFNEADSLPQTIPHLPRRVAGVDIVEWMVIDDGSTDGTAEVARKLGVDHVVILHTHQGLARTFAIGVEESLARGADIIVNTDADNQYEAQDIPKLIAPILAGKAEMVIGERPIQQIKHFSLAKKLLQRLGSAVVAGLSSTQVADATSGFRAFARSAAIRLNVFSGYTYTLETIIQAGGIGCAIASVPIRTNDEMRPSRLVRSSMNYVKRSTLTIIRMFMAYSPLKFFMYLGSVPLLLGVGLMIRWIAFFAGGEQASHIPSLIFGTVLLLTGVLICILACLADLLSVNRRLLEDIQTRVRRAEYDNRVARMPAGREAPVDLRALR